MGKIFTITEGLENMGALRTGGQGSVYKGRRIGEIITAVKLLPTPIHQEDDNDKNFRDFQNEVNKLKKVNEEPNPNVARQACSRIPRPQTSAQASCSPHRGRRRPRGPPASRPLAAGQAARTHPA